MYLVSGVGISSRLITSLLASSAAFLAAANLANLRSAAAFALNTIKEK